jgi:hypothetical protein
VTITDAMNYNPPLSRDQRRALRRVVARLRKIAAAEPPVELYTAPPDNDLTSPRW